jgi:glycosyltransferase involved in cell wall biosynthesis
MNASILIPAWNEAGTLEHTLDAVGNLRVPFETEVIIVAGGADETYEIARNWGSEQFSRIKSLQQTNTDGKAGALTKAIRASSGKQLLFLDADTLVPKPWLIRVVEALENYDAVSCNYEPRNIGRIATAHTLIRKWESIGSGGHGLAGWATIGVNRSVVDGIGVENVFPRQTGGGVDAYFYRVLDEYGCSVGFLRDVFVKTHIPSTVGQLWQMNTRWHAVRYDLDDNTIRARINQFSRSLVVIGSPIVALSSGTLLSLIAPDNLEFLYLISLFFVLSTVAIGWFLTKTARHIITAYQIDSRALHWAPQYLFTEYLYHGARVVAYSLRFLNVQGRVHHFKGERS